MDADGREGLYKGFGVFAAGTAAGADAELVGEGVKTCMAIPDGVLYLGVLDGLAYAYVHRERILNEND